MSWFIFSEVMFFAAFFGALFYMRILSVPDLGSLDSKLIWPDFTAQWPTAGSRSWREIHAHGRVGHPALNTLILLSSGVTVTIAHWGLLRDNRSQLIWGLVATIALGITFLWLPGLRIRPRLFRAQPEAHQRRLRRVFLHADRLSRLSRHGGHAHADRDSRPQHRGHFTAEHHFGFEGVAWYWHFVDVVWLLLFILVYWL
jgi:cytochrome c oxidase subunit 3